MSHRGKGNSLATISLELEVPTDRVELPTPVWHNLRREPVVELGSNPQIKRIAEQLRKDQQRGFKRSRRSHPKKKIPATQDFLRKQRSLIWSQSLGWITAAILFGGLVNLLSRPSLSLNNNTGGIHERPDQLQTHDSQPAPTKAHRGEMRAPRTLFSR